MREIKFRGKDVADGTWVYGGFYISAGGNAIIVSEDGWVPTYNNPDSGVSNIFTNVFYQTVGQYTGLKDKNGKEIYEGDIVNSWADMDKQYIRTVGMNPDSPCLEFNPITGFILCKNNEYHFEIIGNIHEELL